MGIVYRIKTSPPYNYMRRKLKPRYDLWVNYMYDMRLFRKYSSAYKAQTKEGLVALLTMDYHRVEKALSLREPKREFGKDVARRLVENLALYRNFCANDDLVRLCVGALRRYAAHSPDQALKERIGECLKSFDEALGNAHDDVVLHVTKEEIRQAASVDFKRFCDSRYSVRDFAAEPVAMDVIRRAVEIAQKTPSVCNRQSSKVHVYEGEWKNRVLELQNGNRGFRELIDKVLVVTSDRSSFVSLEERNQGWIDSGMFAMSLVYALHSLGVGTCCLNWSVVSERDRRLHATGKIPEAEYVAMLIAVGSLPEHFKVARSERKKVEEVLCIHSSDV